VKRVYRNVSSHLQRPSTHCWVPSAVCLYDSAGYFASNRLAVATGSPTGVDGNRASVHVSFCHWAAKSASSCGKGMPGGLGLQALSHVVPLYVPLITCTVQKPSTHDEVGRCGGTCPGRRYMVELGDVSHPLHPKGGVEGDDSDDSVRTLQDNWLS